MALLKHLEAVGFEGAPRPVGDGFDADGREVITYSPGTTPHPRAWDDNAIAALEALVRRLHDATESFQPPADASWQPSLARLLPGNHPVIGHGDLGPWNVVAQDGVPVALIDWEFAGPVDALWELAETAWLNAQLHDDDIAERVGLPPAARRSQQVRLLLDAYGLSAAERAGFVDRMIEFAVHSARSEAVRYGVTADTATAVDPSGYPVLWAITWRARSASWMLRHRQILERALTLAYGSSALLRMVQQARLSLPLPTLGLMADSSLSVRDRESFLAEPHVAALSVSAGQGRAPLTVPIWYQYAPGGEAWVLTEATSRKARLIETAGRFTLMVDRVMPTVRYVSVEGPVTRTVPGTDELLREITERYLPPDEVPAYIEFANTELGEQVAIYLRPERWLTADLGPGAIPPRVT